MTPPPVSRTLKIEIRFDHLMSTQREADIKKLVAELKENLEWLSGTIVKAELSPEAES